MLVAKSYRERGFLRTRLSGYHIYKKRSIATVT
jgi:hypothetical protein